MFNMFLQDEDSQGIRFYSKADLCREFDKSRPVIERCLDDCADLLGPELFSVNTYRRIVPDSKAKRPRTYFSQHVYDIVKYQLEVKRRKSDLYHQLPNDRRELKTIIIQLYAKFDELINGAMYPNAKIDYSHMYHLHDQVSHGQPIEVYIDNNPRPRSIVFQLNDHPLKGKEKSNDA